VRERERERKGVLKEFNRQTKLKRQRNKWKERETERQEKRAVEKRD
jgi:hypothetical protein